MTKLYIWNNSFSGPLPAAAALLQKFNADNNRFSGEIPAGLAAGMPLLQEFILSSNQLSGTIPASIASLRGVTQMNFSNNQLTGEIPAALGSMPVLNLLDLSSNQLSGSIPASLGALRLNQLNLSSNRLTGEIPAALAISAYDESFLGNPALCTAASSSGNLAGVSSCAARSSDKVSPGLRTGLLVAGIALLVAIAALAFFIIRDAKRRKRLAPTQETWKLTAFQPLDFGESAVLRGLADENLIGKGGSGRVYRVECPSRTTGDGTVLAVKRIWTGGKVAKNLEREFESEVDVLGHVRHTNIVKLLCCLSRAETKLLVYEYMDNGSLDRWLHGHRWSAGSAAVAKAPSSARRAPLDWPARVRVAVGAARGLSYMHHECSPPVVHRDVKCSNILLDSELNAKVADFGLARMLIQTAGTTTDTMSAVAGTFGYMAPGKPSSITLLILNAHFLASTATHLVLHVMQSVRTRGRRTRRWTCTASGWCSWSWPPAGRPATAASTPHSQSGRGGTCSQGKASLKRRTGASGTPGGATTSRSCSSSASYARVRSRRRGRP
jgi:Leucine-rich repeat (LRR) protein